MHPFIFQFRYNDCGFIALKIYLYQVTHNKKMLHLPRMNKPGPYSFLDLKEHALRFGHVINGYRNQELPPFPSIILLKKRNKMHYIVLLDINEKYIVYQDPRLGVQKRKKEKIIPMLSKEYLIFEGKIKEI